MCSGSKNSKLYRHISMENRGDDGILLELAASDDVFGFKIEVEEKGFEVDKPGFWYGRRIGSKKVGFEERTPLMIASMFGSVEVLKYILETGKCDVNRASGTDQATALHCATAGGSHCALKVVKLLLDASADVDSIDCHGNKPNDVVAPGLNPSGKLKRRSLLKLLLQEEEEEEEEEEVKAPFKAYPLDMSLPDINTGIYTGDEFRMYTFKVKPCSRAYSHDWTECPFVHPGENARRRDPRKYPYSCVPCPEFRKGSCLKGDTCEYAHGVFESWLHPAQYKTRLCKDEIGCSRKVCFFAHKLDELRPVYASTGSAMPSPKSYGAHPPAEISPISPKGGMWNLQLPGSRLKGVAMRELEEMSWLRRTANLDDVFGSPTGVNMRQQQSMMSSNSHPSSPYGFDSSNAVATAVMNSRSAAMTKRSQSFIDRGSSIHRHPSPNASNLSGWSSPTGKLDWGVQGDELSKLRKSASFGIRSPHHSYNPSFSTEPDVSWVNSLVRDAPQGESDDSRQGEVVLGMNHGQTYVEAEQMVV